jgi:aminopeptidase N
MINRIAFLIILTLTLPAALLSGTTDELPATLRYRLDLKLDYRNERIMGTCEITILNDTDHPMDQIPVLLYRLLTVKSVKEENGTPLSFTQDIVSIKGWEKLQVNYIRISDNIAPGEKMILTLAYDGFMTGYSNDGWRYVKDHIARDFTMIRPDGFGYPVIGLPDEADMMAIVKERYDYSLKITVPENLVAVSGGELKNVENSAGEKTWFYVSKKPSWRIDVAIADYTQIEKGSNKIFCFRNDTASAGRMINSLDNALGKYSEWFGQIADYKGYTIIEVPEGYSSQADATSFCITADNFKNPSDNFALYHEISHLWNVKPLEDRPCRFESEGLAQFLEFLITEQIEDRSDVISGMAQKYLSNIRKNFIEKPEFQKIPIKDYGTSDMTQYSYTLGMVVFSMFYELTGQENFNKSIKDFYSSFRERGATLDDFIGCCKKYSRFDADRFFNDWIYTDNGLKRIVEGASYRELRSAY